MSDRPIHVVPPGRDTQAHQANSRCPCSPVLSRDLEQPSRHVFIHRLAFAYPGLAVAEGAEQTKRPNWTKH